MERRWEQLLGGAELAALGAGGDSQTDRVEDTMHSSHPETPEHESANNPSQQERSKPVENDAQAQAANTPTGSSTGRDAKFLATIVRTPGRQRSGSVITHNSPSSISDDDSIGGFSSILDSDDQSPASPHISRSAASGQSAVEGAPVSDRSPSQCAWPNRAARYQPSSAVQRTVAAARKLNWRFLAPPQHQVRRKPGINFSLPDALVVFDKVEEKPRPNTSLVRKGKWIDPLFSTLTRVSPPSRKFAVRKRTPRR